jgi:hypothetical protein
VFQQPRCLNRTYWVHELYGDIQDTPAMLWSRVSCGKGIEVFTSKRPLFIL